MTSSARAGEGILPDGAERREQHDGGGGESGSGSGGPSGTSSGSGTTNTTKTDGDTQSTDESMSDTDEEHSKFIPPKTVSVSVKKLPFPKTNSSSVEGQCASTNPRGVQSVTANFNSAVKLPGQTDSVNSSYNAVVALRKADRVNPSLSGGGGRPSRISTGLAPSWQMGMGD